MLNQGVINQDQFIALAETIPHLVWMAHGNGQIYWYNQRWYDYTGTTLEAMRGWGWVSVHDPQMLPAVIEKWTEAINIGEPFDMVFPIRGADGVFRSFLTRIQPQKDEAGRVTQWFGTNTDISALQAIQSELREANRHLEEFAYVTSHDLQEPLRMVSIYTQLMLRNLKDVDEQTTEYATFIASNVKRMETLIRDLLSFSRMVQRKNEPLKPMALSEVLANTMVSLQTSIQESGAQITSEELPTVLADHQLESIFQNLILNSIKYCKKGKPPEIHFSAKDDDEYWIISVADKGIGFEQKFAEQIFGLFKRLHREDEYPGTGLGLAICQRIVERFGGRIWAESVPGEGSTFFMSLRKIK